MACARRDRRARDRGRRCTADEAAQRPGHPGERARGADPAPVAPRRDHDRGARAGRRGRVGVRADAARPGGVVPDRDAGSGARPVDAERHDRGGAGADAAVPVRARADPQGALRPAAVPAPGTAAPGGRRSARVLRVRRFDARAGRPCPPLRLGGGGWRHRAGRRVQPARGQRGDRRGSLRRGDRASANGAGAGRPQRTGTRRDPARAGHRLLPGRPVAGVARGVPRRGRDRPRAGRPNAAGACRYRLREHLLARGDHRRGRDRPVRGGAGGPRYGRLRGAGAAAVEPCPRPLVHRRARPRCRAPARGNGDGASDRLPARPRHGVDALLLVARHHGPGRGDRAAGRVERDRRRDRGHRGQGRGTGMAHRGDDVEGRPRHRQARPGGRARGRSPHPPAVHPACRRAVRLGDRAVGGPAGRGRGRGRAITRVEPLADRAGRVRRVRRADVRAAPRTGPPCGAGAGGAGAGRRRPQGRRMATRPGRGHGRAGHVRGHPAPARPAPQRGARPLPPRPVGGVAQPTSPTRAPRWATPRWRGASTRRCAT